MGYELCIKRKEESQKITKEEWSEYIESNSHFEQIEEFSAKVNENDAFTISTPNAGLWKSDDREVPFTFYEEYGEITVKNPDNRIIEKMILIANELNAIVEGEEGEIYDESYLNDAFSNRLYSNSSNVDKRWWEFWK